MEKKEKKAIVVYSGGLDSRLVVKMMQAQGVDVEALYFKLPFDGRGVDEKINKNKKFAEEQGFDFTVIDCTTGKLFDEYIYILKNPLYPTGRSINNCIDCKEFMFINAKKHANKRGIELIATGEVLGQRPVSQRSVAIKNISHDIGYEVLRPLSAKLMAPTSFEKKGLVDRDKLMNIQGRSRGKQIKLAKAYGIDYPNPAGGCMLCDKDMGNRLSFLLEKGLVTEENVAIIKLGRHYYLDTWYVVGRDKPENDIIEQYKQVINSGKGKPAVYYHDAFGKEKAQEIQHAFIKKDYSMLEKYKI